MASFSKFLQEYRPTTGLRFLIGECYFNAAYNKFNAYKHLNLRWVVGSLGLADHFEYGGKNHTVADFRANPFDSHAWLEDADGNVYDYIFPRYAQYAQYWGKNPTFATNWLIEGISKADLAEDGLEYIPAPTKALPDLTKQIDMMGSQRVGHKVIPESIWRYYQNAVGLRRKC
jgi:hypothetical protein